MRKMEARLVGSLLYIGHRLWAEDVDPDEAVEIVSEFDGPGAPTGVRIMTKIRRKPRKTGTGWPS